jgi:hypothetical protein
MNPLELQVLSAMSRQPFDLDVAALPSKAPASPRRFSLIFESQAA